MIRAWKIREAEGYAAGECELVEGKVGRWQYLLRALGTFSKKNKNKKNLPIKG